MISPCNGITYERVTRQDSARVDLNETSLSPGECEKQNAPPFPSALPV